MDDEMNSVDTHVADMPHLVLEPDDVDDVDYSRNVHRVGASDVVAAVVVHTFVAHGDGVEVDSMDYDVAPHREYVAVAVQPLRHGFVRVVRYHHAYAYQHTKVADLAFDNLCGVDV
jgi:molybdopterin biosynthesis enzyme